MWFTSVVAALGLASPVFIFGADLAAAEIECLVSANRRIDVILHHVNSDSIFIAVDFDCEGVLCMVGNGAPGRDNLFVPRPTSKTSFAVAGECCGYAIPFPDRGAELSAGPGSEATSPNCGARRSEGLDEEAGLDSIGKEDSFIPSASFLAYGASSRASSRSLGKLCVACVTALSIMSLVSLPNLPLKDQSKSSGNRSRIGALAQLQHPQICLGQRAYRSPSCCTGNDTSQA